MLPHRRIARALALASALAALAAPTTALAIPANDPVGSGAAAPPTATGQPGLATIAFETATTSRDQYTRRMTGAFTATGALADAGTLHISYPFGDPRIDATATLIGARGIFTLSLRGAFGATVADHQSGAGRWRVCGGTGAYRRVHGHGRWQAVADFDAALPGMLPPTIRGAFIGRLHRGSAFGHPGRRQHNARC